MNKLYFIRGMRKKLQELIFAKNMEKFDSFIFTADLGKIYYIIITSPSKTFSILNYDPEISRRDASIYENKLRYSKPSGQNKSLFKNNE